MSNINIIQADCLNEMKEMDENQYDLILTDPPYGISYKSGRRQEQHKEIKNDEDMSWFPEFAELSYRILKQDRHFYTFCSEHYMSHIRDWLSDAGFNVKRSLVWVKNNHTSGDLTGDYANQTEFLVFAHKGRRELNDGRDNNILKFDKVPTDLHPTEKPKDMLQYLIKKSTEEKEIVLDPFAGSGSTLLASKSLGRDCTGIEIDEDYVSVIKDRLRQNLMFT